MTPDTIDIDEAFASLGAAFPAKKTAKPRGAAATSHGPNRRRYHPEAEARPEPIPAGPCNDGCRHADRCRTDRVSCQAQSLFVLTGRASASAPRQPTREMHLRLFPEDAQ
jgi:hypothetical protein